MEALRLKISEISKLAIKGVEAKPKILVEKNI